MLSTTDGALCRARALVATGNDEAAKQAYLEVLLADPAHCGALTELGALAHASGFVSAARDAYHQAVRCHPSNKVAHVGYAYLLNEAGDFAAARFHYQAALAIDPDLPEAHQGLARVLTEIGENADEHWQKGFSGHAVVQRRYRGTGTGIPLLMLVAAVGGNIPTQHWIDDRIFAVTAVYADFVDLERFQADWNRTQGSPSSPWPGSSGPPVAARAGIGGPATAGHDGTGRLHVSSHGENALVDPLPPHAMIVNAIGDADLCGTALVNAERIVAHCTAPLVNHPARVRATGREDNARRLGKIPGVVAPRVDPLSRAAGLRFPLLLRAPGYHTGQFFVRVETPGALAEAAASLPRGDPLTIEYLDARGPDGMARKYRVMFIGGVAYPLHLAISADWKVHYFTAAMAADPAFRSEERRFLDDMPAVLGERAMEALAEIQVMLGLDYAGIDFGIAPDGSLLLFEANATMAIIPLAPDPIWDYRRRSVTGALAAARALLPPARGGP